MYENSKLISFAVRFADGLERTYRYSYFCKLAKSFCRDFKSIWKDSLIGQIIDGMFNAETHRSSIAYKFMTRPFLASLCFINDKLSLDQGISESKYIAIIKKSSLLKRKTKADESIVKAMLRNSFYVKCMYEFWEGMD